MKVKAKDGGFDGEKTYKAGDIITSPTHARMLLELGVGTPVDSEAKSVSKELGMESINDTPKNKRMSSVKAPAKSAKKSKKRK